MLHYCTVCGKVHDGRCTPKVAYGKTQAHIKRFRSTNQWINKRAVIQKRDMHCCRVCASLGILNSQKLSVHHIVGLHQDWDKRLDDDNLITLCDLHHRQADTGKIPKAQLRRLLLKPVELNKIARHYTGSGDNMV